MAPLAVVFDGLALHTEITGPFIIRDDGSGISLGTQAIVDFFQGLRMEEFDQAAAEERLTRTVTIPVTIRSATMDAAITNQKSILSRLAGASRYTPKTLTITPNGASTTSTFKVYGGSFESSYTQGFQVNKIDDATLVLQCDPWVYGVTENLGSSGSPLATNVASPASVTLTPTIPGDVPGDVVVFVKNRHATSTARSILVGSVSGDTTWTALADSSTWTDDLGGAANTGDANTKNTHKFEKTGAFGANVVYKIAKWAVPTMPTDRRFTTWLRVNDATIGGAPPNKRGTLQFRIWMDTGQNQSTGEWRSVPEEASSSAWVGVEMGTWPAPIGEVSAIGSSPTTAHLQVMSLDDISGSAGIGFDFALYMPEDSSVLFETADTTQALVAAGSTVRLDQDQVFSTTGDPAGSVARGAHIRARGTSRYTVYLSAGYMGTLDASIYWNFLPVDIWAQYTPRGFHLM